MHICKENISYTRVYLSCSDERVTESFLCVQWTVVLTLAPVDSDSTCIRDIYTCTCKQQCSLLDCLCVNANQINASQLVLFIYPIEAFCIDRGKITCIIHLKMHLHVPTSCMYNSDEICIYIHVSLMRRCGHTKHTHGAIYIV